MQKLIDLRLKAKKVDEREARKKALLTRMMVRIINFPLVKAFKQWNWQRNIVRQLL
jgi:hypothetical protein